MLERLENIMSAEAKIVELKLELPKAPKPVATYKTAVRHGNLLYVSGHGPLKTDGTQITGSFDNSTILGKTCFIATKMISEVFCIQISKY